MNPVLHTLQLGPLDCNEYSAYSLQKVLTSLSFPVSQVNVTMLTVLENGGNSVPFLNVRRLLELT